MKLLFLISILTFCLQAQSILVINSNSKVKRYTQTIEEFAKHCNQPYNILDISGKSSSTIKEYLYNEYPDIVYAVGAKAYQYANAYIPEKEIYFSSIINWEKLVSNDKHSGVSNELYSGMQLILIKSIFSELNTIGVVYSKYTQNKVDKLKQNAKKMGMHIRSVKVDEETLKNQRFDDIIRNSDAMMILPDPVFLNDESTVKQLFSLSKAYKKPVFAYHKIFMQYGATLIMSIDDQTIAAQIAAMIESNIHKKEIQKIQYPAGTEVIFNKKEALRIGIDFSDDTASIATQIVQ